MSRIEELEAFIGVVEAGSITAAADRLGLAKSAVSRRLAALEARLDCRLLQRSTRRMSLTDAGRDFYQRGQRILTDLAEAESEAAGRVRQLSGTLRIAAPLSFGLAHLAPAVTEFARRQPAVSIDLDLNDRPVDLIGEGFDLAIRIARLDDSRLVARRLTPIRHVVCASPQYWATHGRPSSPAELSAHRALRYTNSPRRAWRYRGPDGDSGEVRLLVAHQANNGDFLRQAGIAGLGVMLQPTFIVYDSIESGELEPVLTDYQWRELSAWAVYAANRYLPVRVRRFIDFLAGRFGEQPYWDRCLQPAVA
ncbi:MAG: LysR family transcriptional regulator [Gammaproteobacteria bacterium]|nr:MAG: LysR family transcriptional regulator [Gammaproteobacteria bacterium]